MMVGNKLISGGGEGGGGERRRRTFASMSWGGGVEDESHTGWEAERDDGHGGGGLGLIVIGIGLVDVGDIDLLRSSLLLPPLESLVSVVVVPHPCWQWQW